MCETSGFKTFRCVGVLAQISFCQTFSQGIQNIVGVGNVLVRDDVKEGVWVLLMKLSKNLARERLHDRISLKLVLCGFVCSVSHLTHRKEFVSLRSISLHFAT